MEIQITDQATIREISPDEFNVLQINRIKKEFGAFRQESKGPT